MTKCAELLNQNIEVDFVDVNVGCPIDLVYKKVPCCAPKYPSVGFRSSEVGQAGGRNSVLGLLGFASQSSPAQSLHAES